MDHDSDDSLKGLGDVICIVNLQGIINEHELESKGTNIIIDIFASDLRLSGHWVHQ